MPVRHRGSAQRRTAGQLGNVNDKDDAREAFPASSGVPRNTTHTDTHGRFAGKGFLRRAEKNVRNPQLRNGAREQVVTCDGEVQ